SGLTKTDPLAEYYLDWNNLIGTSAANVDSLLSSFWQQFCAAENGLGAYAKVNQKQLEESYTLLEVVFNAPLKEVKRQYLRLIHQYHPDKGEIPRLRNPYRQLTPIFAKIDVYQP
ncbi:MAG: DNA-J related domain-containing protein, partial [Paraglaciecola chathamensis]